MTLIHLLPCNINPIPILLSVNRKEYEYGNLQMNWSMNKEDKFLAMLIFSIQVSYVSLENIVIMIPQAKSNPKYQSSSLTSVTSVLYTRAPLSLLIIPDMRWRAIAFVHWPPWQPTFSSWPLPLSVLMPLSHPIIMLVFATLPVDNPTTMLLSFTQVEKTLQTNKCPKWWTYQAHHKLLRQFKISYTSFITTLQEVKLLHFKQKGLEF